MDQTRWHKVKEIFAEASDLDPQKRGPFLDSVCAGDPDLRAELDSLLAESESDEHLIEVHSVDLARNLNTNGANPTGRRIGHYVIIGELGHGGMGTVYLAERSDGEFKQRVALKLVRQTIADVETEKRFRREREILASLNHPFIAQLHDGGVTENGEPYFAMEYIDGKPLLEYADRHSLTVKERLELFLKVCSAVAYAHRNLTIHRDLKPSNILVSADGDPKLLDFGLAKILDDNVADQEHTATQYRAFTPAYASPEQILGKGVTTTSDVYSLGVVLFELLTGEKPLHFEGKSLEELVQTLTDSEPEKPSVVCSKDLEIESDLDNMILKCLQKAPARRYLSVEEFSADVERYLSGRPILARPNTASYRASKFLRRNKVAVTAAVVVVISLIAALVVTLVQANQVRQERDRAERRFQDLRKLSSSLLFEITPKIEGLPGTTEARQLLATRATEYLDSLAAESQDDTQLLAELAAAYEKVGDLQGNPDKPNLGDLARAITSYDKAYYLRLEIASDPGGRRALASNRSQAAKIRIVQSDVKGSIQNSEEAIAIYEALLRDTPDDVRVRHEYLETRVDYGQTYAHNNQYDVAIPVHREVLDEIAKLDPNARETRMLQARVQAFLGSALSWDGQQEQAEAVMDSAVQTADSLANEFPDQTDVQKAVWRVYTLASSIYETIKNDVSYHFAERALRVARIAVAADPIDAQAKQNLARAFSRMGITSTLTNRLDKGISELDESKKLILDLVDREPNNVVYLDDLGSLYTRFGDAYKKKGDMYASLRAFEESAAVFERLANADERNTVAIRDLAQSVKNVAFNQAKLGQNENAKASYLKAIGLIDKLKMMNALGKWDEKIFSQMRPEFEKLK